MRARGIPVWRLRVRRSGIPESRSISILPLYFLAEAVYLRLAASPMLAVHGIGNIFTEVYQTRYLNAIFAGLTAVTLYLVGGGAGQQIGTTAGRAVYHRIRLECASTARHGSKRWQCCSRLIGWRSF